MTDPDPFAAATRRHQAGDLAAAEAGYRHVLAGRPDHADAWHQLGLLLAATGRPADAEDALARAVRLRPGDPVVLNNHAESLRQLGRLAEAESACRAALAVRPQFPECLYNLANVLKQQGRHEDAVPLYRRALALRPAYPRALFNLGNALREMGLCDQATDAYRAALALRPDWADAHVNLAGARQDAKDPDGALAAYRRAAELQPDDPDLDAAVAGVLHERGEIGPARTAYAREVAGRRAKGLPDVWLRELRLTVLTEPVLPDVAAIDAYRDRLLDAVRHCRSAGPPPVDVARLHASGAEPPMALAYQGRDDRPLKEAYADLFASVLPQADRPPATAMPDGRHRVGFVVTRGHEGVFLKCLGGVLERFPTGRLRPTVVCARAGAGFLRQRLRNPSLDFLVLPDRLDEAVAALRRERFALLHYWEVGTDSTNYFLPFLRPAAVQCATWGWPVTTGNPCVDHFVSADALEPPDGQSHYVERLVRLPSLPTCYARPPVPENPRPLEAFGLTGREAGGGAVYLCPHNVRKLHPDFDALAGEVLRADARGTLVVLGDERPAVTAMLAARFARTLADVIGRVRVLPRLSDRDYLSLLRRADVVLDSPYYGGGANTVLDAFAAGTPVVTLAGPFHRGRWAAAAYAALGWSHATSPVATSAEAYVAAAVAIANDPGYRRAFAGHVADNAGRVFDTAAAAVELEAFMVWAIAEAGEHS